MEKKIDISKFRLIVFDIDGTIQDTRHHLQPYTRQTLLKLHEAGIAFTLATGKTLPAVRPLTDLLSIKLPLILSNGCVLQYADGKILSRKTLPFEITSQIQKICREGDWDLAAYMEDGIYIENMTPNLQHLIQYGPPGLIEIGKWEAIGEKIYKVQKWLVVEMRPDRDLKILETIYRQVLGGTVEYCHTLPGMFEVMPKGVSKLAAIQELAERMGIGLEQVMVFGDGNNDVEMLKHAGLGIVPENGSQEAKSVADVLVRSCDENGPALFLNQILKQ